MKKRCNTCKFSNWQGIPHCRRLPPTATGTGTSSAFPPIAAEASWCWEFRVSWFRWLKTIFKRKPRLTQQDLADLITKIDPTPLPVLENGLGPVKVAA